MSNDAPVHLHLLESFDAWNGLQLIYEIEPANEIPETYLGQHFIAIALGDFRGSYLLNGSWYDVDYTKGDITIIPADRFPRMRVDREVPLLELFLEPATFARASCTVADNIELIPQWHLRDPLIEHMGLALKTELLTSGADSRLYAETMATALSVHLLRRYSSHPQQIKICTGGLSRSQLRQVIAYIRANLAKNLTQAELSSLVHLSPHYFASLFQQSTGVTPYKYVMKCRIEQAQLLLKRDLTIVEISQEVGFHNQSHFTRVFRQYTGTTPKVYRDQL